MYKNILKFANTHVDESDTVVIDTNALIAKRLENMASSYEQQPAHGMDGAGEDVFLPEEDMDAERVAALLDDSPEGFSEGITGGSNVIKTQPVYDGPTPEEIIAQARAEADRMLQEAQADIEEARSQAQTKGYEDGYQEGVQNGYAEGVRQTDARALELTQKEEALERAYEDKLKELEPLFIQKLTGIYEHVLRVNLAEDSRIIMHLATNALRHIDGCKDFMVHVSREDYPVVSMQKKQLVAAVSMANATLEVIEDQTLSKNECLIETEGGVFDCGLGTQMEELAKQLKLLSYTEEPNT